jgi:allophanate hydrolase subunit 2
MGIRLSGNKLENIVSTNIKSEGLIRGAIQVPADGNPIIMLSDHGTIGGYPKIGVVISADLDRVGQLTPGSIINFKEVSLEEAQNIFKAYTEDTDNYLNETN